MEERTNTLAEQGLLYCNNFLTLERKFKDLTSDARQKARIKQAKPVLEAFWKRLDEALKLALPKSKIWNAVEYALSRKADLETYLEDGHRSISNNPADNSIRLYRQSKKLRIRRFT